MFANEQEKVPQIRFKGFYEDWKVNSLHKMVNIFDGVHQTPNYTDYGIKFLSVENIKTLNSTKYISKKDFKKDFKNPPQKGDIFMTRIGSVGVANIYKRRESVAYYVSLALIKPKSINSLFLFSSINTPQVQKEIWKRTLQVAFPKKINKEEIGKIKLKFPLLKEQFDIGGFFEKIDLQIKSIETTNIFHSIKQYFLQNLFC
ncbi:restriction endonuclease subunit S [Lactobacillus sp. ESL0701]|uniref:restriction endonuclease subunit S n=1 Tax=Lactobacillus sp. ESL0701 TaxID=2983217 RepID=UPI0023F7819C|nr:restriction endonuclease subunit S [Lactobacillus sp. ESL0701]MDF7672921.1 restriction endonuclease subunit S [Lactobacillus sp. ESL0701]